MRRHWGLLLVVANLVVFVALAFAYPHLMVSPGPLVPAHACHVGDSRDRYTCFGCHEHQPDAIRAKHLREGILNFQNCVSCHRSADDKPEGGKGREGRDRH